MELVVVVVVVCVWGGGVGVSVSGGGGRTTLPPPVLWSAVAQAAAVFIATRCRTAAELLHAA